MGGSTTGNITAGTFTGVVEAKTSDYAASLANIGKLWMRTDQTTATLKTVMQYSSPPDTWTASGNMGTARDELCGGGVKTAAFAAGGYTTTYSDATELFDGAAWSNSGALGTARNKLGGCGLQNAGLCFGGYTGSNSAVTEEFSGTAWSSGGNLNTARRTISGCGTQSAGLSFGGFDSAYSVATEEYDGAAWASGGNLATAAGQSPAGFGIQTAAVKAGGMVAGNNDTNVTEEYDGAAWAGGGNLSYGRKSMMGAGTLAAGMCGGGASANLTFTPSAKTEEYNGTSWTTTGDMNTARFGVMGAGTTDSAMSGGGNTGSVSAVSEVYDGVGLAAYAVKTITLS